MIIIVNAYGGIVERFDKLKDAKSAAKSALKLKPDDSPYMVYECKLVHAETK